MKISRLFILTVIAFVAILALASCGECKHENTEWETITESTCTSEGVKQKECEDCKAILETEKLEKSAHIPSQAEPKKDVVCTVCGYIIEPAVGISFSTLSVDVTNVYGKVPSSTESFSFINEIKVSGEAKFLVSLDKYGTHTVATKILPLTPGDNTVYVFEMVGDEVIETYTVTIRRLPIYTVSFDTVGGSPVSSQTVEEGSLAEMPTAPTRDGYTFTGWSYDFTKPITADTTVTASWDVHTNTGYKVEYYLENAYDDGYTLTQTENLSGITDTMATAERKTFDHFTLNTAKSVLSGNISGDGSLVLKVYYRRNTYSLTNANSGYGSITTTGSYKYGSAILTVTATVTKLGYEFLGWYSGDALVSSEPTYVFTADRNIESRFALRADMASFTFSSTYTTCKITGIRDNTVTNIVIPDIVTSIGGSAFSGCTSITSIEIPDSVTSIGERAFYDCYKLVEVINKSSLDITAGSSNYGYVAKHAIEVHSGDSKLVNKDGYLFYTYNGVNYLFGYVGNDTSLSLPDNYNGESYEIYNYAFYACKDITSIEIPDSVTGIGDEAFSGCTCLARVVIGENVVKIGSSAFKDCNIVDLIYNGTKWNKIVFGANNTNINGVIRIFNAEAIGPGMEVNNYDMGVVGGNPDVVNKTSEISVKFKDMGTANLSGGASEMDVYNRMNYWHSIKTVPDPEDPNGLVLQLTATNNPSLNFNYITPADFAGLGFGDTIYPAFTFEITLGAVNGKMPSTGTLRFRNRSTAPGVDTATWVDLTIFKLVNGELQLADGTVIGSIPETGMRTFAITIDGLTGEIYGYAEDEDGVMELTAECQIQLSADFIKRQEAHFKNLEDGNPSNDNTYAAYENIYSFFTKSAKLESTWVFGASAATVENFEQASIEINGVDTPISYIGNDGVKRFNMDAVKALAERDYSFLLDDFKFVIGAPYGNQQ